MSRFIYVEPLLVRQRPEEFLVRFPQALADLGENDEDVEANQVVYICEGQQLCYGTKRAWEVAY